MPGLPTPSAVLLDLDGTLVDTVAARIAGWRAAYGGIGIELTEDDLGPQIGRDGVALAVELATRSGRALDDAAARALDADAGRRFDQLAATRAALPGARALLEALDAAGVPWAIATSSAPDQVVASVAAVGLATPPRVVDGSHVQRAKPAPDLLLLGAQQLGVDPARCWYVGDSTWDMRAAVAAGMVPVAVLAGSAVDEPTLREAGAAAVVPTLAEVMGLHPALAAHNRTV
ncbi:MAG TPA: HAD family phosphatase [Dermatophilaceae bacterium]|nr:HAD family phosphatase [Dermatophilaceae bacterium]